MVPITTMVLETCLAPFGGEAIAMMRETEMGGPVQNTL